jgi:peptide/nickel transport system permease protein
MTLLRRGAWVVLTVACLIALFPDFVAPYAPNRQHRDLPFAVPGRYNGGSLRWLAPGESYRWLGIVPASRRLFVPSDAGDIFVLGTDEFGRDWFSRLCHGASVTLLVAPAAALVSIALALVAGAWAGFRGGWLDVVVMRGGDVFVVLPWFYVVLALRAALPMTASGAATLFIVFAALAVLGSATPARLFRALTLALRTREFVLAARAAGASAPHTVRRHVLPFLLPAAWTQFLVTVPVYIVTEVTLSFLGLGASEPTATWGGMLVPLQQYVVLTSYPWMYAPAVAVVIVCLALHVVGGDGGRPAPANG